MESRVNLLIVISGYLPQGHGRWWCLWECYHSFSLQCHYCWSVKVSPVQTSLLMVYVSTQPRTHKCENRKSQKNCVRVYQCGICVCVPPGEPWPQHVPGCVWPEPVHHGARPEGGVLPLRPPRRRQRGLRPAHRTLPRLLLRLLRAHRRRQRGMGLSSRSGVAWHSTHTHTHTPHRALCATAGAVSDFQWENEIHELIN